MQKVLLYIDGAARGNPGPAGAGVVIMDGERKLLKELHKPLENATNNIAEYSALLLGLEEARAMGAKHVIIHLDSELVEQQLKGEYRVKNSNIKPLFDRAINLINDFQRIEVVKIDRKDNSRADKLANKAINLAGLKRKID